MSFVLISFKYRESGIYILSGLTKRRNIVHTIWQYLPDHE